MESLEQHLRPEGNGRQVYDVAVDEVKAMQRMLNSLQASARMESMRTASPWISTRCWRPGWSGGGR